MDNYKTFLEQFTQQYSAKAYSDEEALSLDSNKEVFAKVLLGVLRYVPVKEKYDNDKYEAELQKKLKFKNKDDYKLLRCCIDLLEDTESAILEFQKREFGSGEIGEDYLRLYGILNAIYQQVLAIIELADLFNLSLKGQFKTELMKMDVVILRNKIGSHTLNFKIDGNKKHNQQNRDFFKVSQVTLRDIEKIYIVSHRGKSEEINLRQIIHDYNKVAEDIIEVICTKAINSLFRNNSENKEWLNKRMAFVKTRRESIL